MRRLVLRRVLVVIVGPAAVAGVRALARRAQSRSGAATAGRLHQTADLLERVVGGGTGRLWRRR